MPYPLMINKKKMDRIKVGTRVGVICNYDNGKSSISLFGYGKYVGDYIPKEAVGVIASILKRDRVKDHKIKLDSGEVIYDCECNWDTEEKVKNDLKYFKDINYISIDKIRKQAKNESEGRGKIIVMNKKGGN